MKAISSRHSKVLAYIPSPAVNTDVAPRLHRLRDLLSRSEDTDMALGSDIYSFSLDAYASLKIAGKGAGLDTLRQAMAVRFNRGGKAKSQAGQPAG